MATAVSVSVAAGSLLPHRASGDKVATAVSAPAVTRSPPPSPDRRLPGDHCGPRVGGLRAATARRARSHRVPPPVSAPPATGSPAERTPSRCPTRRPRPARRMTWPARCGVPAPSRVISGRGGRDNPPVGCALSSTSWKPEADGKLQPRANARQVSDRTRIERACRTVQSGHHADPTTSSTPITEHADSRHPPDPDRPTNQNHPISMYQTHPLTDLLCSRPRPAIDVTLRCSPADRPESHKCYPNRAVRTAL